MGKIAPSGNVTAAGQQGVVSNARDELYEVHPSMNLDGTPVDGYESDTRDLADFEERTEPAAEDAGGPQLQPEVADEQAAMREAAEEAPLAGGMREQHEQQQRQETSSSGKPGKKEGDSSSDGNSSPTTRASRSRSATKNSDRDR